MGIIKAIRYHDICCGHRVVNHESKCRHLHGHNYRIHFHCEAQALDSLGRVIDFSVIKSELAMWLEENWDHKFLLWEKDPFWKAIWQADIEQSANPEGCNWTAYDIDSFVAVPFNPTAENIAKHLVEVIGPDRLRKHKGVRLNKVVIEETRKCHASYEITS